LTVPGDRPALERDVRALHPQLVIATWSWDAAAAAAHPAGYAKILDAAIRQLLSPADGVLGVIFLQMPPIEALPKVAHPSARNLVSMARQAGIPAWNQAVAQAPGRFPDRVMYLPVASSIEIDGGYASWLPANGKLSAPRKRWVRIRTSDGIHLCPPGITRYTAPILQDLTELFHLPPPKPYWWNGYAITVRAFQWGSGSFGLTCPDDHPPA